MDRFPLSPASKRVFQAAADEAALGDRQMVCPEHLLLGLLREHECEGAQLLLANRVTLTAARNAVARIPPDARRESQLRTDEQARLAPGDNPTADELERWIAPLITGEDVAFSAPMQLNRFTPTASALEAQLRRTQMFLGGLGGFIIGYWLLGWVPACFFAFVGMGTAWVNNAWLSITICTGLPLLMILARSPANGDRDYVPLMIAVPLGVLAGTFLSDLWRFAVYGGHDGLPVEPSGVPIDADAPLAVGSLVLAPLHHRWYRAQVIALEEPDKVEVRFLGWPDDWDTIFPRDALQEMPSPERGAE